MHSRDLVRVEVLYAAAERAVKRYERVSRGNLLFILEDLAAATGQVLKASASQSKDEEASLVAKAEDFCRRALADAWLGIIGELNAEIARFWDADPPEWLLDGELPEWSGLFCEYDEIRRRWFASPFMGGDETCWAQAEADFRHLQDIRGRISVAWPALSEQRFKANMSQWREKRRGERKARHEAQFLEKWKERKDDALFYVSLVLALGGIVPVVVQMAEGKSWLFVFAFLVVSFVVSLALTGIIIGIVNLCRILRRP